MLICSASTSDPNWISTHRQHVSGAGICDFGVYIDAELTMSAHITATVRACFAALRQIRSVRRSLTREALLTLLRALVVTKVDYCSSTLAGVSSALLHRL